MMFPGYKSIVAQNDLLLNTLHLKEWEEGFKALIWVRKFPCNVA